MKIYLFDPATRVFLKESKARPGDVPGSWYMPLNSTITKPPTTEAGEKPRWNGIAWDVTEDMLPDQV